MAVTPASIPVALFPSLPCSHVSVSPRGVTHSPVAWKEESRTRRHESWLTWIVMVATPQRCCAPLICVHDCFRGGVQLWQDGKEGKDRRSVLLVAPFTTTAVNWQEHFNACSSVYQYNDRNPLRKMIGSFASTTFIYTVITRLTRDSQQLASHILPRASHPLPSQDIPPPLT